MLTLNELGSYIVVILLKAAAAATGQLISKCFFLKISALAPKKRSNEKSP